MNANPRYTDLVNEDGSPLRGSYAMGLHPNPKFYKYVWRVFHRGMPEGKAFFDMPQLSTHACMTLLNELRAKGEGYLIYNTLRPRRGDVPFDFSHERWQGYIIAPALEDDTDPEWEGFK